MPTSNVVSFVFHFIYAVPATERLKCTGQRKVVARAMSIPRELVLITLLHDWFCTRLTNSMFTRSGKSFSCPCAHRRLPRFLQTITQVLVESR